MPGGAPLNNNNARKTKRWRQAIDKALKQYDEGDVKAGHALDRIALRLVGKGVTGNEDEFKTAMREIGDRIDGKAPIDVNIDATVDLSGMPVNDLMSLFEQIRAAVDTPKD